MASTAVVYRLIAHDRASSTFRKAAASSSRLERTMGRVGRAVKTAGLAMGTAAVAAASAATVMGVKAAADIEHAQKTLTGLYGSAKDAEFAMRLLRKTASKSPIDYQAFTKGAAQLAYMGLKGREANGVLKNVADAVVAVGGTSEDMGRVTTAMLQIQNSGKVYADQLNQISQAGVPIFSGLAAHFNTNIGNIRQMVTDGKVGLEDVLAVVRDAEGKTFAQLKRASKETSSTFTAQWQIAKDNVRTALGTAFMPLLKSLNPVLKKLGQEMPGYIDTVAKKLGQLEIGSKLKTGITFVRDFFRGLTADAETTRDELGRVKIIPFVPKTAGEKVGASLRKLFSAKNIKTGGLGKAIGAALEKALAFVASNAAKLSSVVIKALAKVDWVNVGKVVGGNAIGFALGFIGALGDDLFTVEFWKKHWLDAIIGVLSVAVVGKFLGPVIKIFRKIPLLRAVVPLLEKLEKFMRPLSDAVWKIIRFIGDNFLKGFRKVFPNFGRKLAEWLGELPIRLGLLGIKIVDKAKAIVTGLAEGLGKYAGLVIQGIGKIIALILRPFARPARWLLRKGRDIVVGLARGIGQKIVAAVKTAQALAARARAVFAKAKIWLLKKGQDFVSGLREGIVQRIQTAVDKARALGDKVRATFARAGRWLLGAGKALVSGLRSGMKSGMNGIRAWLKQHVWTPIVKGVKSLFGIHSPSTVFAGFGRDMIRGLTKGLIRNDPKGFVSKVFGGTSKAAAKALGWLFENGKLGWGALSQIPFKLWSKLGGIFGGGNAGAALAFAKAQQGEPYRWGAVGPSSWDCSGFMSALTNVMQGRNPYSRRFTTSSFGGGRGAAGFVRGARSAFQVGVQPGSHMAGTLLGTNVESSGSRGVRVGRGARGASYGRYRFGLIGGGGGSRKGKAGMEGAAFDRGGLARGVGFPLKLTPKPERILSPAQTRAFERLVDALDRNQYGGGDAGSREPTVLELRSSGNRVDDLLLEVLRGAIRVRGGNPQIVLGR